MAIIWRQKKSSKKARPNVRVSQDAAPTAAFTTPNITLTFTRPVVLKGIPDVVTSTGKHPTAAVQLTATTVRLTYDTPGTPTSVTVSSNDPGIRTQTGGYCAAGTFPVT